MYLTSILLCVTLLLSPLTWANSFDDNSQATKAAIHYLELLTKNQYPLEEKTALSDRCEISRHNEIRDQLEFYSITNLQQNDVYTLAEYKTAGRFSALLLRADNADSPLRSQIHAIAMVKRDNIWIPAPLLGSFANTDYGYDPATEKVVKSLELWMAKEQVRLETSIRSKASDTILEQISATANELELRDITPEQAVTNLIQAARSRDSLKMLAIMGAASKQSSITLKTSLPKISKGLQVDDIENSWRFITSPSVIIQILDVDEDKKEVAVGLWNPDATHEAEVLYFPFRETNDHTYVQLSPELNEEILSTQESINKRRWARERGKRALKEKLEAFIFENNPPTPQDNPENLVNKFLKHQQTGDFQQLARLLPVGSSYFTDETHHKKNLQELSSLWRKLQQMKNNPMTALDIMQEGNIAMAPLQFAEIGKTDQFRTIKIWMTYVDKKWHLIPEKILRNYGGEQELRALKSLTEKLESTQKQQQELQSKKMLASVVKLTLPLTTDAPTEDGAKKALTDYLKLLHAKKALPLLSSCAALKETEDKQLLKYLNNALRSRSDNTDQNLIIGYSSSGKWAGVTLYKKAKDSELDDYPLYLIVNTPKGPKVLLDIDLRHPTNRGRRLLNNKVWKQLETTLPEESLKAIQSIFAEHQKTSSANIAKNNLKKEDQ